MCVSVCVSYSQHLSTFKFLSQYRVLINVLYLYSYYCMLLLLLLLHAVAVAVARDI